MRVRPSISAVVFMRLTCAAVCSTWAPVCVTSRSAAFGSPLFLGFDSTITPSVSWSKTSGAMNSGSAIPGKRRAGLDAGARGLRLQVLPAQHHLRLGGEADLARLERHLGADLDRGAVGVGGRHHQARGLALVALDVGAPHQHGDVLRIEAALDDAQERRRDLPLGEPAVELAREAREVLQELGQELEVVFEGGVRALELRELLPRRGLRETRLPHRAAQPQQDRHQDARGDRQPEEEGDELRRAAAGLQGHLQSTTKQRPCRPQGQANTVTYCPHPGRRVQSGVASASEKRSLRAPRVV